MVKIDRQARENLYRAILQLDTVEECNAFFEDIASIRELDAMSQRWEVAYMLDHGKNYQEISAKTGASTATISRVNKCLQYGSDGYRAVLDKMKEGE